MNDFLEILPKLAVLHMINIMQPGVNFVFLISTSIEFGKKMALFAMLGSLSGYALLIIFILFGLTKILVFFPILYTILRYLGCIYLLYVSFKIWNRAGNLQEKKFHNTHIKKRHLFSSGFKVSISNTGTLINILTLFSISFNKNTIFLTKIFCVISMLFIVSFYWITIINIFTSHRLRDIIFVKMKTIERVLAILLVLSVIKVLF
jgi:threonine/homoserine/homoserine lactone efflux protein